MNDNGGTKDADDFTMTVSGVAFSGASSFGGSEAGTTVTVTSFGSYSRHRERGRELRADDQTRLTAYIWLREDAEQHRVVSC